MDDNHFSNENNNNKELNDLKNESTINKLNLRKRAIHDLLDKKKVIKQDEEIENKIFDELNKTNYTNQHQEIKRILSSNNEQNVIKALNYINTTICPKSFNEKLKFELIKCGISDSIVKLFYFNSNEQIFSLCCAILQNFCTQYLYFSTQFINDDGIKIIYDKLSKNFFNNIEIVSNCVKLYNDGLDHLLEQVNLNNTKYNNMTYNSKKILCHLTNWILCEKKIFLSFDTETYIAFFRLIELLKKSKSVPNQYELDFEQGNGAMDNLFSYVLEQPLKELEYFGEENYLKLLVLLSQEQKYTFYLTSGQKTIFDVIKKLCAYLYLNQNSTKEERENTPMLEPFMLGYCFDIMANLPTEVIKRDDIVELIYTLFKNYRKTVKFNDAVPDCIMNLFVSFSENIMKSEKIYQFIFSPEKEILPFCIKFYVNSKNCFPKVMTVLINVFEVKNFDEINDIKNEGFIKCIATGLDSDDKLVNSRSIYCLGKIIEINGRKKYNIDLVRYFEENKVLEKLKNLVLNKNYHNISEEENADELISYIENMIKNDENK